MTKLNFVRSGNALAAVLFVCLFAFNALAQTPPRQQQSEPSYEVVLQVLSASNAANDAGAEAVPQSLAGVVKKLKTMYSYSNYRLNLTYLQRVANTGSLEFKGIVGGANQDVYAPVFSEFTVGQLLNTPDANGQNTVSIFNFRFGQRVPVKTANYADDAGKSRAVVNYESVGLSMQRIGLTVNTPTVVGNLSAAKPDELSFLILTVKQAD